MTTLLDLAASPVNQDPDAFAAEVLANGPVQWSDAHREVSRNLETGNEAAAILSHGGSSRQPAQADVVSGTDCNTSSCATSFSRGDPGGDKAFPPCRLSPARNGDGLCSSGLDLLSKHHIGIRRSQIVLEGRNAIDIRSGGAAKCVTRSAGF